MKKITILFLLFVVHAYGQDAQLIEIDSNQKLYRGDIEGKGSFQLFLRTVNSSPNIGYISTLDGWYSMNNANEKTEVAGIIAGDQMLLFTSANRATLNSIKDFEYDQNGELRRFDTEHHDLTELSANFRGIDQRFILQMDRKQGLIGTWKNDNEEKNVSIRDQRFKIAESDKYLRLMNGTYFNLNNINGLARVQFEIEAVANNGQNILLHYEYQSNLNYNGRCGSGEESGMIALRFDDNYQFVEYVQADFISCYQDIYVDDLIKVSEYITEYKISDFNSNNPPTYIVNYQNATITKK